MSEPAASAESASLEREFKLSAPARLELEELRSHLDALAIEASLEGEGRQDDTYLDTARRDLARAGIGLRVRRTAAGAAFVTFKGAGIVDEALVVREELEEGWSRAEPPARASNLPAALRTRVEPFVYASPLEPLVELETFRRRYRLEAPGGARAELALDDTSARAPGAEGELSFHELEIELLAGDEAPFTALAERLGQGLGLLPSPGNKLQRALEHFADVRPVPSPPCVVEPTMSYREAAYVIFRRHFDRLRSEEPGTRTRAHIERLHKMRVSTRRLRASFRTFGGAFPPGTIEPWDDLMRKTGRALGNARDLDVLLETLPELRAHLPEPLHEDLEPFVQLVAELREAEQRRILRYLSSSARLRGFDRFASFLDEGPGKRSKLDIGVTQIAPALVLAAAKKVYKKGRKIKESSPADDLHSLRIAFKKLRYTLEAFLDVYGKPLKRFVGEAAELQEVLGQFNDAVVHEAFVTELVDSRGKSLPRRTLLATGALVGVLSARAENIRTHFDHAWARFDRDEVRAELEETLSIGW